MTNIELYNYLKTSLSDLPFDSSERLVFARRLFSCITGAGQQDMVVNPDRVLCFSADYVDNILARIRRSEPLEYVFNKAKFLDYEFFTNGNVLIPRPETEELVMMVRDYIAEAGIRADVLDIGTGSGCIPVSLACMLPGCSFTAFDVSADAIGTARQNAGKYGCDVDFRLVDILEWRTADFLRVSCTKNDGLYDVIVSNPPYVMDSEKAEMRSNVLDYEPHNALFVPDGDPLVFYRCISGFAAEFLRPGGRLFFEINERLGKETATLMEDCGFCNVSIIKDLFSKDRFAVGIWPSS